MNTAETILLTLQHDRTLFAFLRDQASYAKQSNNTNTTWFMNDDSMLDLNHVTGIYTTFTGR